MNKIAVATVLAAIGTGAWAKQDPKDSAPVVTVCIDSIVNSTLFYLAKAEASKMFLEVPVRIAWGSGRACQALDAIHIHVREETPETLKPGALAYALPIQGTYIELFLDRIQNTAPQSILPHLLAHVLVHEITHILQGVARHSETGIMKAHWQPVDFREMAVHPLHFAPEDVQLIQMALRGRTARLQALAPAAVVP